MVPVGTLLTGFVITLAIIYLVPFVVYAGFSVFGGLQPPEGSPTAFLLSVLVSKIGTAIAFVLIFYFARDTFGTQWGLYAFLWWLMFVIGEIGQAIGPDYSRQEAVAGIISETIYFPAAALALSWLFRT